MPTPDPSQACAHLPRLHREALLPEDRSEPGPPPAAGAPGRAPVLGRDLAEALPLVLLHGFTGDSGSWAGLLPHLEAGRPVFGIDLIGHGQSEAPEEPGCYTLPVTLAAIGALLDQCGPARAHWLGYSMGGRVALALGLAAPERVASLALVGSSPGIADPAERAARRRADEAWAERIEREGMPAFVDAWMAQPLFASQARLGPERLARMRERRLAKDPRALAATLRGMGTGAMPPLWDELPGLRPPLLLVAGAEDAKFCALHRAMAERLPGATRIEIPEAGHAPQLEAPAALGRALRAFLRGLEAV